MRDFRDAKAMARTLRQSLSHKAMTISHSESLELVSKMLGLSDWNTLSAVLQAGRGDRAAPVAGRKTARYPAMPLCDVVPFPMATYPLVIGRDRPCRPSSRPGSTSGSSYWPSSVRTPLMSLESTTFTRSACAPNWSA
jgi:ATP-dependent Lon protease